MINSIQKHFNSTLLEHNIKDFKYLLAISGGIDSMVLLDLFRQTSTQFQVAHCNFQLRGEDAIGDEEFVRNYCGKYQIPFHSIRFDVEAFKQTGNYSTEMACRILRYDWFDEIMNQNHLDFLVTAHHLNDNIETFLINLSRGTGLQGLTGMQLVGDKIFRPFLNFTKEDLLNYATNNNLTWREDYTNQTDEYTRNKIRHHISPVLNQIHPNFELNFLKTTSFLNETNIFVHQQIEKIRENLIPSENYCEIKIEELDNLESKDFVHFYLFKKYGFNNVDAINKLKLSANSSELTSEKFRLIKDRDNLILKSIENHFINEIIINQEIITVDDLHLEFRISYKKLDEFNKVIDSKNINFPLKLRKIKTGDVFYPLGMNGKKKLVSKFFKDLKLSKIEKENAWLLVDQTDQIIWVVNYRFDERFKINDNSKEFLNIKVC